MGNISPRAPMVSSGTITVLILLTFDPTDRTIRLWHMKTIGEKEHKYTRKNIELDHASHLRFSPDGT